MVSPAQARPCAAGVDAARSGDRRAGAPEGAEQVPATLADVAEADEADPGVPQGARLRDRVVVHRRRPHVAAQRAVLGEEVRGAA